MAATMRRYLEQIGCVAAPGQRQRRRPRAALLRRRSWPRPHPRSPASPQVTRRHIEDYKPWLAARPGQNKPRLTTATLAHRLGTLRMFFVRIDEWGWDDAPPRVPMFPGDLPRQDHPLPKALDDAAAAKLLRAAQAEPRLLVRVTVEVLLRTGLRVGEFTAPARRRGRADRRRALAARPGRQAPRGPLPAAAPAPGRPSSTTTAAAHVAAGNPLLLPRENGRAAGPAHRHPDAQQGRRRRRAAATSTPTSCGTPWPPRPSTAA